MVHQLVEKKRLRNTHPIEMVKVTTKLLIHVFTLVEAAILIALLILKVVTIRDLKLLFMVNLKVL